MISSPGENTLFALKVNSAISVESEVLKQITSCGCSWQVRKIIFKISGLEATSRTNEGSWRDDFTTLEAWLPWTKFDLALSIRETRISPAIENSATTSVHICWRAYDFMLFRSLLLDGFYYSVSSFLMLFLLKLLQRIGFFQFKCTQKFWTNIANIRIHVKPSDAWEKALKIYFHLKF